jgi:hypothetical protein
MYPLSQLTWTQKGLQHSAGYRIEKPNVLTAGTNGHKRNVL